MDYEKVYTLVWADDKDVGFQALEINDKHPPGRPSEFLSMGAQGDAQEVI